MNIHRVGARSSSCVNYTLRKTAEDHGDVFDKKALITIVLIKSSKISLLFVMQVAGI